MTSDLQKPEKPEKLCMDCENVATSSLPENWRCMAPENLCGYSLLDGRKLYSIETCSNARADERACSISGKWFVRRTDKPSASGGFLSQGQAAPPIKPAVAQVRTKKLTADDL